LRLERLNAMRESGARLMARDRIGRDIFLRGEPEGLRVVRTTAWDVSYFELISAYGQMQARTAPVLHVVKRRAVMTLEEALERVSAMIGQMLDWTALEAFLPRDASPQLRRSALASSFLAMLELAKRGTIDLMQEDSFSPLLVKAKKKEMQPC
jgi:segregation and condensation protein A